MAAAKGLGRGLSALLGEEAQAQSIVSTIKMAQIEPNAAQPRKAFSEQALAELAESVQKYGVITPITVRKLASGYYQIVAGERRWRAAKRAGLRELPCVVIEADDRKVMELALVENLQREDLNPLEEGEGYRALIEDFGLTQEEAAARVGKSRPAVANAMRLLALPEAVKALLSEGALSGGQARTLLGLKDADAMERLARLAARDGMSVRELEKHVKRLNEGEKEEKEQKGKTFTVNYLEEIERRLQSSMGRKVKITPGRKKGRIELEYYGNEDLERLIDMLSGM